MSVSRRVEFFAAVTPPRADGVQPPYSPVVALATVRGLPLADE